MSNKWSTMNKGILNSLNRIVLVLGLLTTSFAAGVTGQGTETSASNSAAPSTSTPNTKKTPSPKDELEDKLRKSFKDPPQFVANLAEYLNKYPYSERGTSYLYSLSRTIKEVKDQNEALSLVTQFIKGTEQVPAPLKGEIYRRAADALYNQGLFQDTADLSQKAIDLFDDKAYLDFEAKQHEFTMAELTAKNPSFKKRPFDIERQRGYYVGTKTDVYNLLGKSLWELGKFDLAEKAYRNSFEIKKNKNAAMGIAKAAEKSGKDADALEYAAIAVLTGKAEPAETEYFHSLYAKSHGGKTDGVEEYLDALYKKSYINPVKSEKYRPTPKRTDRTVLAEFVTGTGCVPCIPVDYTFEKALKDYSRKDLILLVYHWHAPVWDPLDNYSSDSRVKYYEVQGAPTIFFDGKKSDKEGDYYGSDGEAGEIQEIADGLNGDIKSELDVPADAKIKLKADQNAQNINVSVNADDFQNVSNDLTLHIALVENEVTYSGENGLRFQMMVVRALAGDNTKREFGFKVDPSKANKFNYVFDVNKIVAQNASYYDTFVVEKTAEFKQRFGGNIPEGLKVEFKYKKNEINPNNLSVVAFLQDNKTKKVLQSSFVSLASK